MSLRGKILLILAAIIVIYLVVSQLGPEVNPLR